MLYFASFFEPQHQHGSLIAISRTVPKNFKVNGRLEFLAPSPKLLTDWKEKRVDSSEYTQRYREQMKQSWGKVKQWLDSFNPQQHSTLLCWEVKNTFCHRNLVALLVQKHRPDCFGGCDVTHYEAEHCPDCDTGLISGLDASRCTTCNKWWSRPILEKKLMSKGLTR